MTTKLLLCLNCRDYIVNDEINDMPIEVETAMFVGAERFRREYSVVSFSRTEDENSFKCDCCRSRVFSEISVFEAFNTPGGEV